MKKASFPRIPATAAAALLSLGLAAPLLHAETPSADYSTCRAEAWREAWPLEYYSAMGSADHIDDLADPNFGYGHWSQGKFMMKSIAAAKERGEGINATCLSCKSVKFNAIHEKYGSEVFLGKKSVKYAEDFRAEDFWSCTTCHSDIRRPAASLGAQIMTPALFGHELFEKLPPKTAACAQCHNNLSPWSDSRIIPATDLLASGRSAYRNGWDPEGLLRTTLEDARPTDVRYPEGKTYEESAAAHARTDRERGIYLFANGNHADAELFIGSIHFRLGMGCADCHMPVIEDRSGVKFRSHDSSKSVLNSKASMQYCLSCHKSERVKDIRDMVGFVRNAQARLAEKDRIVAEKLDRTYGLLREAIDSKRVDEKRLDRARFEYARASYYKEYVYGNRGATPGEKVAHNPELAGKYLEQAARILDDIPALLE